jgi:hypothetical protein
VRRNKLTNKTKGKKDRNAKTSKKVSKPRKSNTLSSTVNKLQTPPVTNKSFDKGLVNSRSSARLKNKAIQIDDVCDAAPKKLDFSGKKKYIANQTIDSRGGKSVQMHRKLVDGGLLKRLTTECVKAVDNELNNKKRAGSKLWKLIPGSSTHGISFTANDNHLIINQVVQIITPLVRVAMKNDLINFTGGQLLYTTNEEKTAPHFDWRTNRGRAVLLYIDVDPDSGTKFNVASPLIDSDDMYPREIKAFSLTDEDCEYMRRQFKPHTHWNQMWQYNNIQPGDVTIFDPTHIHCSPGCTKRKVIRHEQIVGRLVVFLFFQHETDEITLDFQGTPWSAACMLYVT